MRFTAPTGSGRRQDRLGTFRDRLTLVFGNGREDMNGQVTASAFIIARDIGRSHEREWILQGDQMLLEPAVPL